MTALRLTQIRKEYPGHLALEDISFQVEKGSVHAFLGPNGAGKSTTMKIIAGLIPATSGSVEVNSRIGFLPENPPLYLTMKVGDYLQFVYDIQTLKSSSKNSIDEVIERCGLATVKDRLIGNLSKGYKQRVGIAQALVFHPEIIILDEPTVGLDPQAIVEIRELILSLKKDHTILLSTHQLYEAQLICNDITIINRGRILKSGRLDDVQKSIQTTQLLKIKIRKWSDQQQQEIADKFKYTLTECFDRSDYFDLTLSSQEKLDRREEFLEYLIHHKLGVLEIYEQRPDLEEIFKHITQAGDKL